ncbi:hypothetical protein G9A89_008054 [Geosiphon pyriformis]|nr:hypothetical protein G9A89_008054 [Geosiphon pyriformis]
MDHIKEGIPVNSTKHRPQGSLRIGYLARPYTGVGSITSTLDLARPYTGAGYCGSSDFTKSYRLTRNFGDVEENLKELAYKNVRIRYVVVACCLCLNFRLALFAYCVRHTSRFFKSDTTFKLEDDLKCPIRKGKRVRELTSVNPRTIDDLAYALPRCMVRMSAHSDSSQ